MRYALLLVLFSMPAHAQNASKRLQALEEQMAVAASESEITAAIDAHEGESNPHPVYLTNAEAAALFQGLDSDLTTWAGLTPSAFFQTLVNDTDAATARSTLGLGAIATQSPTGTPDGSKFLRDDYSWQTPPGGAGGVDTANSPNANEFARFTDADTIEGRTASEFKADVDLEVGTDLQAYSANLDEYAAVNPTAAGLTLLDDANAAAQLVNLGLTPLAAELNHVDGVTGAIQTQLDAKLASASYTAADVLSKLLTVDGSGNGVDADLLDGSSSAAFQAASSELDNLTSNCVVGNDSTPIPDSCVGDGSDADTDTDTTNFNADGDNNSPQTINATNELLIAGGTNGVDTVAGATDTVTINLDLSESAAGGELGGNLDAPTLDDSVTVTGWVMGASTATSASADDSDTSLATTAFVQGEIDDGDLLTDNCTLENDATPIPDSCVGDGSDAGGGGGVDTANSPNAAEWAKFTDADTIEGRTASELKSDLDLEIGTDMPAASLDFLVGTATAGLSGEIVAGTSPNGELGGTWASPTVDDGITLNSLTLGNPTFSAGTASAGTHPKLTPGTVMTTAEDGAIEMNGEVLYGTTDAGNRGYIPIRHVIRANATRTLPNDTNENAIFNSPANGRITLETGTYIFKALIGVTAMNAASGNALIDILGAGTATVNDWLWSAVGKDGTLIGVAAVQGVMPVIQSTPASMFTAGTGTELWFVADGTFTVTGAGTLIPSIDLVTAAAAVVAIGSYFSCERIGDVNVTNIGQVD